ncbi:MAG: hypothetical protein HOO06_06250 [Bdellovibrionaceae bacterium]|jgi:hypothetical protein|nr:hypothetical protein [Pseudobdellovibrionaceae bacterium]
MYLKTSILLVLSVFFNFGLAESVTFEQVQSRTIYEIGDSSVGINGPIYIVSNRNVESIEFPNLEFVNGPIYIVNNQRLRSVSFPKLKFVNGPIYITYNSSLETTDFYHDMYINGPIYYFMNFYE